VHGGVPTVNAICDHPAIKAVSFVGGDRAGRHIYERHVSYRIFPECAQLNITQSNKKRQAGTGRNIWFMVKFTLTQKRPISAPKTTPLSCPMVRYVFTTIPLIESV
jgi:hypothetical protein